MMVFDETTVPGAALPVQVLKDHLRLGSGFADDGMQDALIEGYLRAAMATIEGRIGKVLMARRMRLELDDWRNAEAQPLPVAPVSMVVSVTMVDAAQGAVVVPATAYRLVPDLHRPRVVGAGSLLPSVPNGGVVKVVFEAGFSAIWAGVPADLQQAVLLLAAEYYEHRHDSGAQAGGLPFGVVVLIERWRTVRVLGGGA
ncbi:MAG: hypothetical protein V4712_02345 [Pseudomonadota bacterium]